LRHVGDERAARPPPITLVERQDVASADPHSTRREGEPAPRIAENGKPDGRLARSRFADKAEDLAALEA
jgi:hypothetical protein